MYDKEYLYKSMTKGICYLGKVLARKYRHLNIGYKIFMFGLIATVLILLLRFFSLKLIPERQIRPTSFKIGRLLLLYKNKAIIS